MIRNAALLILAVSLSSLASAQGLDTGKIEQALGRSGQKLDDVYKVGYPRTDLHVTVGGVAVRPGLALGSWAAFSGSDERVMMMGDLVLLPAEVGPVMGRLREGGIEITAVHNHLLGETPRVMYMHYMGHGKAAELAAALRRALAASKTPLGKPAPKAAKPAAAPKFVGIVESALGRKGNFNGGVDGFGIPRADAVTAGGMTIPSSMGVAESINFQEAGPGKVATTGDFVLTADEVNPVISALLEHHLKVTALHSHMLNEEPRLFFMHFWGVGAAKDVAEGIKAALEKVHTK